MTEATDGTPNRIRRLLSVIGGAREDLRAGRRTTVGRLKSITTKRFSKYVTTYSLVSAGLTQTEVATLNGWSPRVVSEIVKDLHDMGFAPDNSYLGQHIEVMRELQEAIPGWLRRPADDTPVDLGNWAATVTSPWADGSDGLERSRLAGEAAIRLDLAREPPGSDTFTPG